MNLDLHYSYIVLGKSSDYYLYAYSDVEKKKVGRYIYKELDDCSELRRSLYHVHMSKKINNFIDIPFKSKWNQYVLPRSIMPNSKPICFVFFAGENYFFRAINYGFGEYLRKKYPDCKLVAYYQDLVSPRHAVDILTVKNTFDLVFSFDHGDCEKYGLIYQPLVYSCPDTNGNNTVDYDVYFVGHAKDRLNEILETFVYLKNAGLKCDFHITGTSKEEQLYSDEIDYCENIPYLENIKHIKNSKAILEIMQGGGKGFTLRYCEAIAFDRLLISNNPEISQAPFYKNGNVIHFNDPNEINVERISLSSPPYDYQYKEKLSPLEMFRKIESFFNISEVSNT